MVCFLAFRQLAALARGVLEGLIMDLHLQASFGAQGEGGSVVEVYINESSQPKIV
jgi:hypothetical protein